jgi:hypothetical protein
MIAPIVLLGFLFQSAQAEENPSLYSSNQEQNESEKADPSFQSKRKIPDWLYLAFEQRTRYETLDNRFRLGETGSDQQLPQRTRLRVGIINALDPLRFSLEMEDSRTHFTDSGSTVTNQMVNELDFLQLYVSLVFKKTFQWNLPSEIHFGRQSFDMGNRRLFARNMYRNATNAFDGLRWTLGDAAHRQMHVFLFQPVSRRFYQLDHREHGSYLWGFYFSTHKPSFLEADAYYFGIRDDPFAPSSQKRRFTTLGGRLYRNRSAGKFHFELESAWQKGTRGALDHFAHFQHLSLGYSGDTMWKPVVTFKYDYASGDKDPNDEKDGTFDTLFGARRFEYGPTGIYGPIYRSNLNSPAIAFEFRPVSKLQVMPALRWMRLAQSKDRWVGSNLRDLSGKAGTDLGRQLELRLRFNATPYFLPEVGYTRFFKGSYEESVPKSPPAKDSNYLYVELNFKWDPLFR